MAAPILHLASASPRRQELLQAMGVAFTFSAVDVDETPQRGEGAADMVLRLATAKALAGVANVSGSLPVLAADTTVTVDDRILGKPTSQQHALEMLTLLSGKTHDVVTGVAVVSGEEVFTTQSVTQVVFREILSDEAVAYWRSGEPADKAGGYAVQGLGGVFVRSIVGSYSGVVGLPVFETAELLQHAGIDFATLAASSR